MTSVLMSEDLKNFKENKCSIIKNIISEDLLNYLNVTVELDAIREKKNATQVVGSKEMYNMLSLNIVNQIIRTKIKDALKLDTLYSTYTFYRKYYKGQELTVHTDRPSCEISLSLCLSMADKTKPWSIFFKNNDHEITYEAKPSVGDGVLYLGCELPHWREKCEQKWVKQIFFHYSTNAELEFDNFNFQKPEEDILKSNFIKHILEQL